MKSLSLSSNFLHPFPPLSRKLLENTGWWKTKQNKKSIWTHLVCLPSYLWHKCIFPIWWYTDSEQQSWQWSTSICKGQRLYFKEMSPPTVSCQGLQRATEEWEKEGRRVRKTFPSIQSAAIIHVECWNVHLWCVLSWGLSWSQLHFQPVEESGVLWR